MSQENWSEEKHQQKLFVWFNNTYPEFRGLFWHNYNNPPNAVKGVQLVSMGLLKGLPDMTLSVMRKGFGGLYLELKRIGEKPRKEQKIIMGKLEASGYYVAWSDNLEESKRIIQEYLWN